MGEVTISDFPGGTPVPTSCPIGKCRTEVCKSEFNKLFTEKFVESNFIKLSFLMPLHLCDNFIKFYFDKLEHVVIH